MIHSTTFCRPSGTNFSAPIPPASKRIRTTVVSHDERIVLLIPRPATLKTLGAAKLHSWDGQELLRAKKSGANRAFVEPHNTEANHNHRRCSDLKLGVGRH